MEYYGEELLCVSIDFRCQLLSISVLVMCIIPTEFYCSFMDDNLKPIPGCGGMGEGGGVGSCSGLPR